MGGAGCLPLLQQMRQEKAQCQAAVLRGCMCVLALAGVVNIAKEVQAVREAAGKQLLLSEDASPAAVLDELMQLQRQLAAQEAELSSINTLQRMFKVRHATARMNKDFLRQQADSLRLASAWGLYGGACIRIRPNKQAAHTSHRRQAFQSASSTSSPAPMPVIAAVCMRMCPNVGPDNRWRRVLWRASPWRARPWTSSSCCGAAGLSCTTCWRGGVGHSLPALMSPLSRRP